MYQATTRSIRVTVTPQYLDEESSPEEERYIWAYTIEIRNLSDERVQLRARHWQITDEVGRVQEVHGAGVVGEQPTIDPGDSFEYTSGVPLTTPSGIMVGAYDMVSATGERFSIDIPAFSLDLPRAPRTAH